MVRHVWSIACAKSVIDPEENTLSLIEVFEELTLTVGADHTPGQPITVPLHFEVVSLWIRGNVDEPSRATGRLTAFSPQGTRVVAGLEYEIDLTRFERVRSRIKVQGLAVAGSGYHRLDVEWRDAPESEWQLAASLPLKVTVQPVPT